MKNYDVVIGLEVHIELKTATKAFCSCSTIFGEKPNTNCCPSCMGFPGTVPKLNRKAFEYAIKAGLAFGCDISEISYFDRKNYFYPDLPKAYQISQCDTPVCKGGKVHIETSKGGKDIHLTRLHFEEDAGKLLHQGEKGTMIDFNRAGIPLIEVVTEPDMNSAEEVVAFLKKLRLTVLYLGISDCKMNEGSMRCDINLSVKEKGSGKLGVRTEIKNVNSFAFAAKAVEAETKRQISLLENGEKVVSYTMRFDEKSGLTSPMRIKESQGDYRFFRDTHIPPVQITYDDILKIKKEIPMLPDEKFKIFTENYGISKDDANILISDIVSCAFFDESIKYGSPFTCAKFIVSDLPLFAGGKFLGSYENFAKITKFFDDGKINYGVARKIVQKLAQGDFDTENYIISNNLIQITDENLLSDLANDAIKNNGKAVCDYFGGKNSAFKTLIGYCMKKTSGKASPAVLSEILIKKLNESKNSEV